MGSWGKYGDYRPARAGGKVKPENMPERRFRIPKGEPGETWVTSFCEKHGFTDAKLTAVHHDGSSTFHGECGCDILHGDFLLTLETGQIVNLKPKQQISA